jgi:hypothetical protein
MMTSTPKTLSLIDNWTIYEPVSVALSVSPVTEIVDGKHVEMWSPSIQFIIDEEGMHAFCTTLNIYTTTAKEAAVKAVISTVALYGIDAVLDEIIVGDIESDDEPETLSVLSIYEEIKHILMANEEYEEIINNNIDRVLH